MEIKPALLPHRYVDEVECIGCLYCSQVLPNPSPNPNPNPNPNLGELGELHIRLQVLMGEPSGLGHIQLIEQEDERPDVAPAQRLALLGLGLGVGLG